MLQILAETLRIARLRIKELEAETNIQTTELNRLKEYVNASESAGRTMYGQQVDELKQVITVPPMPAGLRSGSLQCCHQH